MPIEALHLTSKGRRFQKLTIETNKSRSIKTILYLGVVRHNKRCQRREERIFMEIRRKSALNCLTEHATSPEFIVFRKLQPKIFLLYSEAICFQTQVFSKTED
jgi:hypothetical protein